MEAVSTGEAFRSDPPLPRCPRLVDHYKAAIEVDSGKTRGESYIR
jgi:hypothetical protein